MSLCGTLWKEGLNGRTGMEWQPVIRVAESLEIDIDEYFFRKLSTYEQAALGNLTIVKKN